MLLVKVTSLVDLFSLLPGWFTISLASTPCSFTLDLLAWNTFSNSDSKLHCCLYTLLSYQSSISRWNALWWGNPYSRLLHNSIRFVYNFPQSYYTDNICNWGAECSLPKPYLGFDVGRERDLRKKMRKHLSWRQVDLVFSGIQVVDWK